MFHYTQGQTQFVHRRDNGGKYSHGQGRGSEVTGQSEVRDEGQRSQESQRSGTRVRGHRTARGQGRGSEVTGQPEVRDEGQRGQGRGSEVTGQSEVRDEGQRSQESQRSGTRVRGHRTVRGQGRGSEVRGQSEVRDEGQRSQDSQRSGTRVRDEGQRSGTRVRDEGTNVTQSEDPEQNRVLILKGADQVSMWTVRPVRLALVPKAQKPTCSLEDAVTSCFCRTGQTLVVLKVHGSTVDGPSSYPVQSRRLGF
ncbi:hypothetical protein D5F01_LYC19997 [Larimichthys crocea]|uniref:Uncharacterized protein n=1 Tax=Larimichthys crocea TaxID=215358 RepID=A0A6G0HUD5_LARCR|nr:hypothetical protein D5F01_LYC19997 [Larimichthys crocea]